MYSFPSHPHGTHINGASHHGHSKQRPRQVKALDLPVELLADIMDHVGDWELARAVGVPTSLPQPVAWTRASPCDNAMLTGYLPVILAADPASYPPTKLGATVSIRFAYVNVLEYFLTQYRSLFRNLYKGDIIPIVAAHHGRTSVLSWWKHAKDHNPDVFPPISRKSISDAIDGASRNGQVPSLDWWLHSGLPMEYTEAALEMASAKNQIDVLDWWKDQSKRYNLHLKIGRVMDMASTAGHVEVIEWWSRSQLDFKYDRQAMYHASCHGKVRYMCSTRFKI